MYKGKLCAFAFSTLLLLPVTGMAANSVLTDTFNGSEPRIAPLPGTCSLASDLAYQDTGTFQVSATGDYVFFDALWVQGGIDIVANIYQGAFNPANPNDGLITTGGIDESASVSLQAGTDYTLVVQHYCDNALAGAWALTVSGPGNVTSNTAALIPDWTEGVLRNDDPVVSTDCSNGRYREADPFQVSTSGVYYMVDTFSETGLVDVCVHIYTAPFDPANPLANRVATSNGFGDYLDESDRVELEAETDYYVVTQAWRDSEAGEYFFVFAPPAPFRINKAVAGAWFNLDTAGQGFFIDVYESINFMFAAWFTFDLERPVDGSAQIGDPGHRWMTAYGNYSGDTADLTIEWTEGGVFDSSEPPVTQDTDGSMTIRFTGCSSGTVDYDLGTAGVVGQVPIQTVPGVPTDLCDTLTERPGNPGPL